MKDSEQVRKLIRSGQGAKNLPLTNTFFLEAIATGIAALLEWKEAE